MKKYILFAGISIMSIGASAQYYGSGNYMDIISTFVQGAEKIQEQYMYATISLTKSGADKYKCSISYSPGIIGKIKIIYRSPESKDYAVDLEKCEVIYDAIINLPFEIEPGESIFVDGYSDLFPSGSKRLAEKGIPRKGSREYAEFKAREKQQEEMQYMMMMQQLSNGQNIGTIPQPPTSTTTGKRVSLPCKACKGAGKCGTCNGTGYYIGSYGVGTLSCPNCSASNGRICSVCNGKGSW